MNWLPGLGNPPHTSQNSNSCSPPDPEVDEVEFSVVCDGCGTHFWSLSKAHSHAALTAHVLREITMSPSSPVGVLHSPVNSSARASETNTVSISTAEAEADTSDQEDGEDSGDDNYPMCYDCGRYFWCHEEADYHARIGHIQDTETVPSTDGSSTSASASPVLNPAFTAAESSIHSSYPYWNFPTPPGYSGGVNLTSPRYNEGVNPNPLGNNGSINTTSLSHNGGANPAFTYLNTSPTSGHAMTLFGITRPFLPNISQ